MRSDRCRWPPASCERRHWPPPRQPVTTRRANPSRPPPNLASENTPPLPARVHTSTTFSFFALPPSAHLAPPPRLRRQYPPLPIIKPRPTRSAPGFDRVALPFSAAGARARALGGLGPGRWVHPPAPHQRRIQQPRVHPEPVSSARTVRTRRSWRVDRGREGVSRANWWE